MRGSTPLPQPSSHCWSTCSGTSLDFHIASRPAVAPGWGVHSRQWQLIARGSSCHWAETLRIHNAGNFKPSKYEARVLSPATHQESVGCSGPLPDSSLQHLGCLIMLGLPGSSCQVPPSASLLLFLGGKEGCKASVRGRGGSQGLFPESPFCLSPLFEEDN